MSPASDRLPLRLSAIESSCDEMAAAVVRAGARSSLERVHAQVDVHAPYGGVVPELASRDHVRCVSQVVARGAARRRRRRRRSSAASPSRRGPASSGSLLVGLCFGKALAFRHGIPAGRRASPGGPPGLRRARRRTPRAALSRARRVGGTHGAVSHRGRRRRRCCSARRATTPWARHSTRSQSCSGCRFPGGPAVARDAAGGRPERAIPFPRPLARPPLSISRTAASRPPSRSRSRATRRGRSRPRERRGSRGVVRGRRHRRARGAGAARARAGGTRRLAVVGGVAANQRLRSADRGGRAQRRLPRRLSAAGAVHGQRGDDRRRRRMPAAARRARRPRISAAFARAPLGSRAARVSRPTPFGPRSRVMACARKRDLRPELPRRRRASRRRLANTRRCRSRGRRDRDRPRTRRADAGAGGARPPRRRDRDRRRSGARAARGGALPANVELLHADALAVDLAALAVAPRRARARGRESALRDLVPAACAGCSTCAIVLAGWLVMVQREVARAARRRAGHRDYGSLAVLHALTVRVERVRGPAARLLLPGAASALDAGARDRRSIRTHAGCR